MPIHIKGSGGAQKTPVISVSSSGLITATAGKKSATTQLSTQGATTIRPTTVIQTAVASGKYTTGTVYVEGDSDLLPQNIVSGVSLFGVAGTARTAKTGAGRLTQGDGTKLIWFYPETKFSDVNAIFINCRSAPANDRAVISMAVFPDAASAILFDFYTKSNNGFTFGDILPSVTVTTDGYVQVALPQNYDFYFDANTYYYASIVGS